jgi:hypothetical protein
MAFGWMSGLINHLYLHYFSVIMASGSAKNRQIEFSCHSSFQSWDSCTAGATQDRGQFDVYGDDYFANRQRQSSPFTFPLSYLTTIHSPSRFDKTSLSKCVTHVGFDKMT